LNIKLWGTTDGVRRPWFNSHCGSRRSCIPRLFPSLVLSFIAFIVARISRGERRHGGGGDRDSLPCVCADLGGLAASPTHLCGTPPPVLLRVAAEPGRAVVRVLLRVFPVRRDSLPSAFRLFGGAAAGARLCQGRGVSRGRVGRGPVVLGSGGITPGCSGGCSCCTGRLSRFGIEASCRLLSSPSLRLAFDRGTWYVQHGIYNFRVPR
jgi:hypothetical protein